MPAFDVIFLSYDEPNAEENWQRLLQFSPRAKRVSGVKGIHDALRHCARLAEHERFYLVDADSWIVDGFRFRAPRPDLPDRLFTWRARNAVNDLVCGKGNVKLLSKNVVASMKPDAVDETYSTEAGKMFVPEIASEIRFNSSPFQAWRSAFRECAKRAAAILAEFPAQTRAQLWTWQTTGSDRRHGEWAILGARQGARFGRKNRQLTANLLEINDFERLRERFAELQAEIAHSPRAAMLRARTARSDASPSPPASSEATASPHLPAPAPPPPRFLFLSINKRCNLRCQHCNFWTLNDDDRDRYLSIDRRNEIIGEFARMSPQGRLVTCGGESMLDLDEYFDVSRQSRALGLTNLSVINGTRIRALAQAERMILEGPHEISVSLNSHREELHDRTRGVTGAFRKAVDALRLLLEARARHPGSGSKVYAMGLIFDENYRELDAFYDFVLNGIGADKLKLNFLQPSFGAHPEGDDFFARHHDVDPEILGPALEDCDAKYGLGLSPVWKSQVRMYFRSVRANRDAHLGWGGRGTEEHICNTYERNIMVDHYGVARLCFSTGFPGVRLRKPGDLEGFWNEANPIRCAMKKCNAYCGISHSVRRESATLKLPA